MAGGLARDLRSAFELGTAGGLADGPLLDRFAVRGDQAAFAAVVARHGPMVLAVCRGVLRSRDDAEDAFQATFLILARKASSLRRGESLGGWLQRVARRVAIRANGDAARRLARERPAARFDLDRPHPAPGPWDDVLPLLHEEIGRLPEKYRAPIVLCDLEELTRDEAAGQLGWPPGTVAGRLARGRDLLRTRLARRGVAPSVLTLTLAATAREASASVPHAWAEATAEAACHFTQAGAGISSAAANLAKGTMTAMLMTTIRRAAATALASGLALAVAAGLLLARPQAPAEPKPTVPLTGIVLDADGKPASDVAVFASSHFQDASSRWGRVVAEVRTDAAGHFRIELPTRPGSDSVPQADTVLAYRPGRLLASLAMFRNSVSPDVPIKLVLGPPASVAFEVRDPAGKPVAGAKIEPRVTHRAHLSLPDGVADRVAADTVTDASGRASLSALMSDEVSTVIVAAPGYGTQQFGLPRVPALAGVHMLDLLPVGRLAGRIVGEPVLIRRRLLSVIASSNARPAPPAAGLYHVTTDDEGRFVLPEIVAGIVKAYLVDADPASPWYAKADGPVVIEPLRTTPLTLTMTRGVAVRGIAREKGTGRPIAGVKIGFQYPTITGAVSDEQGRYAGFAPPGYLDLALQQTPKGYASLMYALTSPAIPLEVAEYDLPPIELIPARTVRGGVADQEGKPIPGARVDASWTVNEGSGANGTREVQVKTDGRGEFVLEEVPVDAQVALNGSLLGLRSSAHVVVDATATGPVRLRLVPGRTVAMSGRVLARGGAPLVGARVHLRARKRYPSGQVEGDDLVALDGVTVFVTDREGRFRTLAMLDADGEYTALAEADGREPRRTGWIAAGSASFPDLILAPAASSAAIRGRTVDTRGRVVVGAVVRSPGQLPVRSDEGGWFRIEGLAPGPIILSAEAPGFRPHREVIAAPTDNFDAILTRLDEAP